MLTVARALEEGWVRGVVPRAVATGWSLVASRAIARPLRRDPHVRVVAVGGATLGGSGKTPLAIACAHVLHACGVRVAFVGHAYRASPRFARVVRPFDDVAEVGDEALVAARALDEARVPVVVAPSRQYAVDLASELADVLVLDGPLQCLPRADLALLALDADEPWGRAESTPPCGDLRAPVEALLAACDGTVAVGDAPSAGAVAVSRGVALAGSGERLSWSEVARLRVGLATALARPSRLLRFLARRGVYPCAVASARDHGGSWRRSRTDHVVRSLDLWLATEKCALHWAPPQRARSLAVVDYELTLSRPLRDRLARVGIGALTRHGKGNTLVGDGLLGGTVAAS